MASAVDPMEAQPNLKVIGNDELEYLRSQIIAICHHRFRFEGYHYAPYKTHGIKRLTYEVIGVERVVVPDLNNQTRWKPFFSRIQTPEMKLRRTKGWWDLKNGDIKRLAVIWTWQYTMMNAFCLVSRYNRVYGSKLLQLMFRNFTVYFLPSSSQPLSSQLRDNRTGTAYASWSYLHRSKIWIQQKMKTFIW